MSTGWSSIYCSAAGFCRSPHAGRPRTDALEAMRFDERGQGVDQRAIPIDGDFVGLIVVLDVVPIGRL